MSSASFAAMPAERVTVSEPPPAGTVPEPLELLVPLFTVAESVPAAQLLGILATVTLTTFDDERFWMTDRPVVEHFGTLVLFAPKVFDDALRPVANPVTTQANEAAITAVLASPIVPRLRVCGLTGAVPSGCTVKATTR